MHQVALCPIRTHGFAMTTPRATLTETNEKWLGARTRVGEELSHIRELQTSRECANSELAPGKPQCERKQRNPTRSDRRGSGGRDKEGRGPQAELAQGGASSPPSGLTGEGAEP